MLEFLNPLRDLNVWTVMLRMGCAVLCGGLIGLERSSKRRPAGFRTHILICLGAAITTMTSQYLGVVMHYFTDVARLGAQVIAGIGFIGAGTIIVTRRRRVKGLTTAAGLWASAIIGLTLGAGFYEGGVLATGLVLLAELVFSKVESRMSFNVRRVNVYVEYAENETLERLYELLQESEVKITDMEITHSVRDDRRNQCAVLSLDLGKGNAWGQLSAEIAGVEGVIATEEL